VVTEEQMVEAATPMPESQLVSPLYRGYAPRGGVGHQSCLDFGTCREAEGDPGHESDHDSDATALFGVRDFYSVAVNDFGALTGYLFFCGGSFCSDDEEEGASPVALHLVVAPKAAHHLFY